MRLGGGLLRLARRRFGRIGKQGAVRLVETELRHAGGEMVGQGGDDIERRAVRMIDDQAARMEMHLAADAAGEEGVRSAVFAVADDRMTDRCHMHPQLMRAASQRLELDPGGAVARAVDHPVAGARGQTFSALIDHHLLAAAARLLGQRQFDQAVVDIGHAGDQRPIGLACRTTGKTLGEIGRAARSAGNQQDAAGILIEPVDQTRPRTFGREGIEQPVDMLFGPRSALRREAGRLVEHDGGAVLGEHHALGLGDLRLAERLARRSALAFGPSPLRLGAAGGNAQRLASRQPVFRRCPLAVDPDLPGARPAADRGKADQRQMALEPAIEAHAVVVVSDDKMPDSVVSDDKMPDSVGCDSELANCIAHAAVRMIARPAISPSTPPASESST